MAYDKFYQKRRAKQLGDLKRKSGGRSPYARVLIACEGSKTEPNYFKALKDDLKLNSANIEICGDCGSSPTSILDYALNRYREEKDKGNPFDKIFCAFDKDQHGSGYDEVLNKIKKPGLRKVFIAITSVPCFEFWLLLHFGYTTSPFSKTGNRSAADNVIRELKECMPAYSKANTEIYWQLIDKLPQALINSRKALEEADRNNTDNPSSRVHELIEFLQGIKQL